MIFSNDPNFIYLDTPKCASRSMATHLTTYYGAAWNGMGRHRPRFPKSFLGHFVFSTVRNPYSRAVSCWYEILNRNPYCGFWRTALGLEGLDCGSFWRWYEKMSFGPPNLPGDIVLVSQMEFLSRATRWPDVVLRMESLDAEAREKLPWWVDNGPIERIVNPQGNGIVAIPGYGDWREHMTDEIAVIVQEWAGDAFERFGYSRDWREGGGSCE